MKFKNTKMEGFTNYLDALYYAADKLEDGSWDLATFYKEMELVSAYFFSQKVLIRNGKRLDNALMGRHGLYPHKHLYRVTIDTFILDILPLSPCALIEYLLRLDALPSIEQMRSRWEDIAVCACENPDPKRSVLKLLVETGCIPPFVPAQYYLRHVTTEKTLRYLLEQGCDCKRDDDLAYDPVWFILSSPYYDEQKPAMLRTLLEYGADFLLTNWPMIDLASFRVIEEFSGRDAIHAWIAACRFYILIDTYCYWEIWPYLVQHYDFRIDAVDFMNALQTYASPEMEVGRSANPVLPRLTYEYAVKQGIDMQRVGLLLNWCVCECPIPLANNLAILDRYLDWQKPAVRRYFSRALRRRLFAFLCVFRRIRQSTVELKPILHFIVPYTIGEEPTDGEDEDPNGGWCCLM